MTTEQRFLAKIGYSDGCWNWKAAILQPKGKRAGGYGRFTLRHGKGVYAHRYAYELFVGTIPVGKQIDHVCRNRACVNPSHLELVDCQTNVLRGTAPPAFNAKKQFCPNGHELSGSNLAQYQLRVGKRTCRICANARLKAKKHALDS